MKTISLCLMIVFYIVAGTYHFIHPGFYRKIMPPWVPLPDAVIFISGVLEIMFGVLLIFFKTRRIAAWGLIGLLIIIFPANIQMMLNYLRENNRLLWITVLRLPLQIVLIGWAYSFIKPVWKTK